MISGFPVPRTSVCEWWSICDGSIMAIIDLPTDFKEFLRSFKSQSDIRNSNLTYMKVNKKAAGRHKDLDDLENLP